MLAFFSRRLRMWLLLAIALPLARALVHRLALTAERRDPSTRTAKTLAQAEFPGSAEPRPGPRKKKGDRVRENARVGALTNTDPAAPSRPPCGRAKAAAG